MERIITFDQSVFRWINGHSSGWLDWTLWSFSQGWSWLVIILAAFLFVAYRSERKNWLWLLIGLALCFLLADQISTNAIKDGVQRLRPCYELEDVRMFHTGKGGHYGFVSSHAANAFAVAMFLGLMYKNRKRETEEKRRVPKTFSFLMFTWAVIVCYSRCYLGKHYPGDVVCGALLGLGVGALVYFVICKIRSWISSRSEA